ncbi:uncharacterized protein LOC105681701 [Bombus impatiens]|uniref:Uncharacterized protein LOC105681701 n=1 Tax=Bombus impatiens TaxID=132113 RepID=A0A6P3V4X9_BOMIM|nr:uncharacterized protein LOC105681701 [Bombus impatiens]
MADETVQVGSQMKYLGLVIESQWTFEPHFDCLIPKVSVAANALSGLLPYIGGGEDAVRRFYESVILSRAMYGTPVWADDLLASCRSILLLRRLHERSHLNRDQNLSREETNYPANESSSDVEDQENEIDA